MAESIIHELNAQFNDLDLKSKNKIRNKVAWKEDSTVNKKYKHIDAEERCMPYYTLTDSKDITYICSLCGGNLYANITKHDVLKENLHYTLICPRGCAKAQNKEITQNFDDQQLQSMGAEYNYSACQPHDMVAMQNHDYRFNLTTDLMAARTARLKQLLNTIDCDNCQRISVKEKSNRFEAFKRNNVRRAEYQLSMRKSYNSSASDYSSDLSSMAEGMFECSERLHRFYEQMEYNQGCEKCGGI